MTEEEEEEQAKAPLLDHLIELRQRLIWALGALFVACVVSYAFAEQVFGFLMQPLANAFEGTTGRRLIYTGLAETFFTYLKVAFFTGMFISFPVIATQIWKFVAPGLYRNERSAFMPFLVASPVLFVLGGALVYYLIFPMAARFFIGFETPRGETPLPIEFEGRVSEYLSFMMALIFAFGLFFQIPILLTLLARAGIVTADGLASKRRYAIVGLFVIAAVLTPPDIISQIGLAIPGIALYEISIFIARLMEKKRAERQREILGQP